MYNYSYIHIVTSAYLGYHTLTTNQPTVTPNSNAMLKLTKSQLQRPSQ